MDVFLPTITILFLIVGQLGLLVRLILTHVAIIPVIVRQLIAVLRIYRGLIFIKETACRGREGPHQERERKKRERKEGAKFQSSKRQGKKDIKGIVKESTERQTDQKHIHKNKELRKDNETTCKVIAYAII